MKSSCAKNHVFTPLTIDSPPHTFTTLHPCNGGENCEGDCTSEIEQKELERIESLTKRIGDGVRDALLDIIDEVEKEKKEDTDLNIWGFPIGLDIGYAGGV